MAATSDSLVQQVEALRACCPVLCPAIVPNGYDVGDLVDLLEHSGRDSVQAFEALLESASQGASSCCVCGADGKASCSSSSSGSSASGSDEDEDSSDTSGLFFTVLTSLDFKSRNVVLQRAGFACTLCRALRSTSRMVRFAALRVGQRDDSPDASSNHRGRLLELAAHLASLNRAPDSVQASPEALAVWLQEVYCRAYALQVVASNLGGWRVVGPDGAALSLARGRDVVAAAALLLGHKQGGSKASKGGDPSKQAHGEQPSRKRASEGPAPDESDESDEAPDESEEEDDEDDEGEEEEEEEQEPLPPAKKQKSAGGTKPGAAQQQRAPPGKTVAAGGGGRAKAGPAVTASRAGASGAAAPRPPKKGLRTERAAPQPAAGSSQAPRDAKAPRAVGAGSKRAAGTPGPAGGPSGAGKGGVGKGVGSAAKAPVEAKAGKAAKGAPSGSGAGAAGAVHQGKRLKKAGR